MLRAAENTLTVEICADEQDIFGQEYSAIRRKRSHEIASSGSERE
jgi:hypothetical protein